MDWDAGETRRAERMEVLTAGWCIGERKSKG